MTTQLKYGRRLTKAQRAACRREGLRKADGILYRSSGELAELLGCHRDTARYWMARSTVSLPGPKSGMRKKQASPAMALAAKEYRDRGMAVPEIALALAEDNPQQPPEERVTAYQLDRLRQDEQWPPVRVRKKRGTHQEFEATEPGFLHVDTVVGPQTSDPVIFTARERSSRLSFAMVSRGRKSEDAALFLTAVRAACPLIIHTVLTDNGSEFKKDFAKALLKDLAKDPTKELAGEKYSIEHRHTKARRPQTNGMVERFNGLLKGGVEADNGWWNNGTDRASDNEKFQKERFGTPLPDRQVKRLQRDINRWLLWVNLVKPNRQLARQTPLSWLQNLEKDRPDFFQHSTRCIISQENLQQITKGLRGQRYLKTPPEHWTPSAEVSIML